MQLAFEHKALGNLPETILSKFGMLKRDNTASGLNKRRFILFVDFENEKSALEAARHLDQHGTIALECQDAITLEYLDKQYGTTDQLEKIIKSELEEINHLPSLTPMLGERLNIMTKLLQHLEKCKVKVEDEKKQCSFGPHCDIC
jgi:hypothetical protein